GIRRPAQNQKGERPALDQTQVRAGIATHNPGHFSMKIPGQISTEIYSLVDNLRSDQCLLLGPFVKLL
ncbi:MAG: hypothetical protein ACKO01_07530, partial [Erythrobacter sp.]